MKGRRLPLRIPHPANDNIIHLADALGAGMGYNGA